MKFFKFTKLPNSLMWCFWRAITFIWTCLFRYTEGRMRSFFLFLYFFFIATCSVTVFKNPTFFTIFHWFSTFKNNVNSSAELLGDLVGQIICLEKEVVVLERNQLLLSPASTSFFSWGFPDNSCAFGNYATEKVCKWGSVLHRLPTLPTLSHESHWN